MSRTFQIDVTADVIAQQKRWARNTERCPVATAMSRALGWPVSVGDVSWGFTVIRDPYPLPAHVTQRIERLAKTGQMAPFTFEVEIPG